MMAISVDLFETVVTRRLSELHSLAFSSVGTDGKALASNSEWSMLRCHRRDAERKARNLAPGREPTLREIYRQWASDTGISEAIAESLSEFELELEERVLCLVPGAVELVRELRKNAGRILYISDIHLPSQWLEERLRSLGLFEDGDRLYVSCEERASKERNGALFRKVLQHEGITPTQLTHYGNNGHSDKRMAERCGIKAVHLPRANLNRYERVLENHAVETEGWTSLLAGASRLARLEIDREDEHSTVQSAIACGVAAPLQITYVAWLLQQSHDKGIRRLYFLARDGYPLWRCAEKLAPRFAPGVELRYLHVSRAALFNPLHPDEPSVYDRLFWPRPKPPSLATLAHRLQLPIGRLRSLLPADLAERASAMAELDSPMREALWGAIRRPGKLRDTLARERDERLAIAGRYFHQEGLLEHVPSALVDVGWNGSTKRSIDDILDSLGGPRPDLFLFACRPGSGIRDRLATVHSFTGFKTPDWWTIGAELLMETFCAAPEGSTLGYGEQDGRIVPMKASGQHGRLEEWGMSLVQDCLQRTTGQFTETVDWLPTVPPHAALAEAVLDVLREFALWPGRNEAFHWGSFPYDIGMGDDAPDDLAPNFPHGLRNLIAAASGELLLSYQVRRNLYWKEGSLANARGASGLFRLCEKLGRRIVRPTYFKIKQRLPQVFDQQRKTGTSR